MLYICKHAKHSNLSRFAFPRVKFLDVDLDGKYIRLDMCNHKAQKLAGCETNRYKAKWKM